MKLKASIASNNEAKKRTERNMRRREKRKHDRLLVTQTILLQRIVSKRTGPVSAVHLSNYQAQKILTDILEMLAETNPNDR